MNYMINILFIILTAATFIACNSKNKHKIDDEFYNIDVLEFRKSPLFIADPDFYLYETIDDGNNYGENFFTRDTSIHKFWGDELEIQFFRIRHSVKTMHKPCIYFIGAKRSENDLTLRAFYVLWIKNPDSLDIKFIENESNSTDSIYTNLDYNTLKKIYPFYKGKYKYKKIDNIRIYYIYPDFYIDGNMVLLTKLDGFDFVFDYEYEDKIKEFEGK